jgi:dTDP-4-dehydrorhamnose 3,5-epimerase
MKVERLAIPDVVLVTPVKHGDQRGFFSEVYNSERLKELAGIEQPFVQDNHSLSVGRGVVRGLHFQTPPHAQGKLVRVIRGAILDVAVDLRHGSPTFGQHVAAELSGENWCQLWVPEGFAHGFCTLTEETEVIYKVTSGYAPANDKGVRWDDPALGVAWPVEADKAILSEKDQAQPAFEALPAYFTFTE